MPVPKCLLEAEKLLKDRCTNYLIVAIHDEQIWTRYDSSLTAYGMAAMTLQDCESRWAEKPDEEQSA